MKKVKALGFRSNSWFAGLNTTIPDSDTPECEELSKIGGCRNESDDYDAQQLRFPVFGEMINEHQFIEDGKTEEDSWSTKHFVFED